MPKMVEYEKVAQAICNANGYDYIRYIDSGNYKETFQIAISGINFALKVFKPNNNSERTDREISAMKRVDCSNIAKLIRVDSIIFDSKTFLYMLEEYLGGGSLSSLIKTSLLSKTELVALGDDIIKALSITYENHIVHRDIKPDNIMFREGQRSAVLVDLGLVRDLDAASLTQAFIIRGPGTPYYSSPEQLTNKKAMINWRSDQFSLGITLCLSFFGFHPFESGNMTKTVEKMASFSLCNKDIAMKLKEAGLQPIVKMLEPFPIRRFRTPYILMSEWRKLEEKPL
jgi:serine/threonine protein kinase